MRQFSFLSKTFGKILFLPAVLMIVLTVDSCQKDRKLSIAQPEFKLSTKSVQIHHQVAKVLRGFVTSQAGGSSQQSFAGSGSNIYSNVTMSKTTYSNPQRSVYAWSDPTTPTTSYTLTVSESAGGGLGQLSYAGKSFDYSFALSISIAPGATDPDWGMSAGSFALHMIVAIDGDMGSDDFTLRNLAIFLAAGDPAEGNIELGNYQSGATTTIGIGELIDLSSVVVPTPANMDQGKFYYTSGGHMNVTATTFEMGSDAKVKDAVTGVEYIIDGALMSE